MADYYDDPDDGLPVEEVGIWAREKHERLTRYIDISRAVRKKFLPGAKPTAAGATYIDLYSGPGRVIFRDSQIIADNGAVAAYKKSLESGTPFSEVHVADDNERLVEAIANRLNKLGATVYPYHGKAETTVQEIASRLNPYALHFAFLDPYNLAALPFSVIERLAKFKRMDILVHVSASDLQRNFGHYLKRERDTPLDAFAPGWRDVVGACTNTPRSRGEALNHWLSLVRSLDMKPHGAELITALKNQPLYWLMLVARHDRAVEFWEKIRNLGGQPDLNMF